LFTTVVVVALVWLRSVADENRRLGRQGEEAHGALCVFKADLEQRANSSRALLEEHKGPMIFGIPRTVIQTSFDNQQKTVDSLRSLDCEEGGTP
jgi:hypothetical protein